MASNPDALLAMLLGNTGQGYNGMQQVQQDQQVGQLRQQQIQGNAQQLQGVQAAQQQQQMFQQDTAAWVKRGSRADELPDLAARYPDQAKALQESWKMKNDAQKQADRSFFGQTQAALSSGSTPLALKNLRDRRDAESKIGGDTQELDYLIDRLNKGGSDGVAEAKAAMLAHLYADDPDKYAEVFGIGKDKYASATPGSVVYNTATGEKSFGVDKADVSKADVFDASGNKVGTRTVYNGQPVSGGQIEQLALNAVPGATVTSRTRTPEHNAEVGGVPNSYHLTGEARDLVPPDGMTMANFAATLKKSMPGMKILNEGTHVHVQPIQPNRSAFMAKPTSPASASADNASLDSGTIKTLAEQYLAGDASVFQNLGRGKQGSANIVRMRQEVVRQAKAMGWTGRDIAAAMADFTATKSAERAVGTRVANVDLAATEAQRLAPLALDASNKLPRASWLTAGKIQEAIRNQTNDPRLGVFVAANNGFVNAYSRAISPSGVPTVSGTEHAREMLSSAAANGRYNATVNQMLREIEAAKAAPRDVRADIKAGVTGRTAPAMPAGFKILSVRPK